MEVTNRNVQGQPMSDLAEKSDTEWANALGLAGNHRDQVLRRMEQIRALKAAPAPVQPKPMEVPAPHQEPRYKQPSEPYVAKVEPARQTPRANP